MGSTGNIFDFDTLSLHAGQTPDSENGSRAQRGSPSSTEASKCSWNARAPRSFGCPAQSVLFCPRAPAFGSSACRPLGGTS